MWTYLLGSHHSTQCPSVTFLKRHKSLCVSLLRVKILQWLPITYDFWSPLHGMKSTYDLIFAQSSRKTGFMRADSPHDHFIPMMSRGGGILEKTGLPPHQLENWPATQACASVKPATFPSARRCPNHGATPVWAVFLFNIFCF